MSPCEEHRPPIGSPEPLACRECMADLAGNMMQAFAAARAAGEPEEPPPLQEPSEELQRAWRMEVYMQDARRVARQLMVRGYGGGLASSETDQDQACIARAKRFVDRLYQALPLETDR